MIKEFIKDFAPTVGDVLVVKNEESELEIIIPSTKMIYDGWKLNSVTKDGKLVYTKPSKMNL
jgi:hypothetical protein